MAIYTRIDHDYPSLVTTVCANRASLFSDPSAADLLIEQIVSLRHALVLRLLAFVVMPDHLHLVVVRCAGTRLPETMQLIKGRFARRWNTMQRREGPVWQTRYDEKALRTEEALLAAIAYVHQNPVHEGLVTVPEEYRWSSAHPLFARELDLAGYLGLGRAG